MNKKGFTLIELMVSMFVAMIVFGGVYTSFQNQKILFLRQEMIVKLNRDKRATFAILQQYINGAGMHSDGCSGIDSCGGVVAITNSGSGDAIIGERIVVSADKDLNMAITSNSNIESSEIVTFIVGENSDHKKILYLCPGNVTAVNRGVCSFLLDNITVFDVQGCDIDNNCSFSPADYDSISAINITLNAKTDNDNLLGEVISTTEPIVTNIVLINKMIE